MICAHQNTDAKVLPNWQVDVEYHMWYLYYFVNKEIFSKQGKNVKGFSHKYDRH